MLMGIVLLMMAIMLVQLVDSVQVKKVPINLKLERRQNFTMDIIDNSNSEILQTISGKSDGAGEYLYTYYHWIRAIKLEIEVKKDGQAIKKGFGPYILGENVTAVIDFFNDGGAGSSNPVSDVAPSAQQNDSSSSENNLSQNLSGGAAPDSSAGITGLAIDSGNAGIDGWAKYLIIGVVIVLCAGTIVMVLVKKGLPSFSISSSVNDRVAASVRKAPELELAERKIEDLQHQVSMLKNEERIKELERNIAQSREEINRLRKG